MAENPWITQVRTFHELAEVPLRITPNLPTEKEAALALSLIDEEYRELVAATQQEDLVAIADGVGDLLVVTIRYALVLGLPLDYIMAEIDRSNMSKFDWPDGSRRAILREDGKVLKSPLFSKPHIASIILEARRHAE